MAQNQPNDQPAHPSEFANLISIMFQGHPTKNYHAVIQTAQNRLIEIGVPAVCFDADTRLTAGFTDKLFASYLRLFEQTKDAAKLEKLLLLGINRDFFDSFTGIQPQQFYAFLRWLKSGAGRDAIATVHRVEKLRKRALQHLTDDDLSLIDMTDAREAKCKKKLQLPSGLPPTDGETLNHDA